MGLYIKQNGAIKPLAGSMPGEGLPVGAITAFTANTIPSGWLLCDGSTFDETLYPSLFIALGGNVLPDLRNRFLEGADSVQPASYTVNYIIKATSGITTEAALDAFNMIKEYERKQNLLSDIETITLTETDTVMPYDGYISAYWSRTEGFADRQLIVNGVVVGGETSTSDEYKNAGVISYLVKQGDRVRINNNAAVLQVTARWYKERDYEGR